MNTTPQCERCWSCGEEVVFSDEFCPNCKSSKFAAPPPPLPHPRPAADFRQQSVWALIGLTIITATIYWPFWLRRNSRILNQHLPHQRISSWFFPVLLGVTILNIAWGIPEALTNDQPVMMAVGKVWMKADMILSIAWVFKIRNRLNVLLKTSKPDRTWFSGLWTFVFGIFYIQHKLNRYAP